MFKNEIVEELKESKYNDLENMVCRFRLIYDEIIDILDLKYIPTTTIGYTLLPGMYEVIDFNFMLKFSHPREVKVNITIIDFMSKSNLTTNKTLRFTEKSFFYILLGFNQSHSGELGDIGGFVHLITGTQKIDSPIRITGIDKVHLKADCI